MLLFLYILIAFGVYIEAEKNGEDTISAIAYGVGWPAYVGNKLYWWFKNV